MGREGNCGPGGKYVVMAAYRRVYDSHHPQADCQEPVSAPEPYDRQSSVGYLYLFIFIQDKFFNKFQKIFYLTSHMISKCR